MKKKGKGMACMIYPMDAANKSSSTGVFVKMNHDGTAVIFSGSTDLGQGSDTVLMQIAAETLGIPVTDIRFITSDTEITPYDEGTGASRVTYIVGHAVKEACEKARDILFAAASRKLGIPDPRKFYVKNGYIYFDTFPSVNVSVKDAARISEREHGVPVLASATYGSISNDTDKETGQGRNFEKHIFATQIAEVEVDTETGHVEVLKFVAVHDCGRAINPMLLEGQIEGGVMMGIGYTFLEEMIEDTATGELLNDSFRDYQIPRATDLPKKLIVDYVEVPDKDGPYGALGIGEPTPAPVAPAIVNAVYDAVGIRFTQLPITPEKVLKALKQAGLNH